MAFKIPSRSGIVNYFKSKVGSSDKNKGTGQGASTGRGSQSAKGNQGTQWAQGKKSAGGTSASQAAGTSRLRDSRTLQTQIGTHRKTGKSSAKSPMPAPAGNSLKKATQGVSIDSRTQKFNSASPQQHIYVSHQETKRNQPSQAFLNQLNAQVQTGPKAPPSSARKSPSPDAPSPHSAANSSPAAAPSGKVKLNIFGKRTQPEAPSIPSAPPLPSAKAPKGMNIFGKFGKSKAPAAPNLSAGSKPDSNEAPKGPQIDSLMNEMKKNPSVHHNRTRADYWGDDSRHTPAHGSDSTQKDPINADLPSIDGLKDKIDTYKQLINNPHLQAIQKSVETHKDVYNQCDDAYSALHRCKFYREGYGNLINQYKSAQTEEERKQTEEEINGIEEKIKDKFPDFLKQIKAGLDLIKDSPNFREFNQSNLDNLGKIPSDLDLTEVAKEISRNTPGWHQALHNTLIYDNSDTNGTKESTQSRGEKVKLQNDIKDLDDRYDKLDGDIRSIKAAEWMLNNQERIEKSLNQFQKILDLASKPYPDKGS